MSNPATLASPCPLNPSRRPLSVRRPRRILLGSLIALVLASYAAVSPVQTTTATAPTDGEVSTVPNLAPGNAEIDIDAFWRQIFSAAGIAYSTPAVVPFSAPINSGCGYVTPAQLTAFYCAADVTVYWSTPSYDQSYVSGGDAAWVNVMAHEWSHHAQVLLGTNTPWRRANDMVSLELEATCLGGLYVASARDRGLVTDDMITTMVGMFSGSPYHGTTEQVQNAFLSGLTAGASACGIALPAAPQTDPVPAKAEEAPAEDTSAPRPAQVIVAALNLRSTPSTSAPVRTVLSPASRIDVTGEAQIADGYTWYPVTDRTTGLTGFVAAPYLQI